MAVKTFGTEVLTSADTNTYLANSGLVYVTSQTVGSTVASVTVSNAFSATYDNYLITMNGNTASNLGSVIFATINGSTGTTYQSLGYYMAYGSTTITGVGGALTNLGFRISENSNNGNNAFSLSLFRPFLVSPTAFSTTSQNDSYIASYQGKDTNAASSTSLTFTPSSGTLSSGTITVYGFRKG